MLEFKKIGVAVLGVGLNAQYKITRFFGLGAGIGYRQMLSENDKIREALNSPLYVLKIKVFIGEFFRKKPNNQKKES